MAKMEILCSLRSDMMESGTKTIEALAQSLNGSLYGVMGCIFKLILQDLRKSRSYFVKPVQCDPIHAILGFFVESHKPGLLSIPKLQARKSISEIALLCLLNHFSITLAMSCTAQAGRLRANSSKSVLVATPKTNRRLSSVTTANSCFPFSPFSPPLKNSSSSSNGVCIVMIWYTLPFLRNLTIAFDTSSVSWTLPALRSIRR